MSFLDDNGYPNLEANFDGRILSTIGGSSGDIRLLNGKRIRFPWKTQEEVADSAPPRIQSYEVDSGGQHTLNLQIGGAVMVANAPTIDMVAPYPDETDQPSMQLSSGSFSSGDSASIILRGHATLGTIELYGNLTGFDSLAIDSITDRVGPLVIDSATALTLRSGGTLTVQPDANQNLALTTTGTGDIVLSSGDGLTLDPAGALAASGSSISLVSDGNGNVTITASGTGDLALTGAPVTINGVDVSTALGAWADHTPTVLQSVAITIAVTRSKYVKLGRTVIWEFDINIDSSGTASHAISLSLPVTAAAANMFCGRISWYDGSKFVEADAYTASTTTINGIVDGSGGVIGNTLGTVGGITYLDQLTSDDVIRGFVIYEAAS